MKWTQEEIEKAMTDVRKKAMTDKTFRELALAEPLKALREINDKDVPEGLKIKVIESDPAYHMTFVLPQMAGGDLSDDELEQVAGGGSQCVGAACAGEVSCVGKVR